MSFIKKYYPTMIVLIILLCSFYSLGVFDVYFIENVCEKKYELGDFSYTGELKDGKFEEFAPDWLGYKTIILTKEPE